MMKRERVMSKGMSEARERTNEAIRSRRMDDRVDKVNVVAPTVLIKPCSTRADVEWSFGNIFRGFWSDSTKSQLSERQCHIAGRSSTLHAPGGLQ